MEEKVKEFSNKLLLQISKDEEDYEILQYGLHQSFIIAVNLLSVLICGMFWHEFLFSLLLFLCLYFLRPYAGGYHADTEIRCYFISVGIMNLAMMATRFLNIPISWKLLLYVCAALSIWRNAPLENPINLLEEAERIKYSTKAKQILVGYSLLAGIAILLQSEMLYEPIIYGTEIVALSVLAGMWKYESSFTMF